MTDTIVLGLDGGNWGVIEKWLNAGDLPNIESLREQGSSAVSKSEFPPVTCPNWKCYSTGKNPGAFGVFWWEQIDFAEQEIKFPDSTSFKSAELWDYFADEGCTWASLNMPTTYPPREIPNGDIIAGGPLCADNGFTSDPGLEDKLKEIFSYRVFPPTLFKSNETSRKNIEAALAVIESRFDVAEWYLDTHDPDFFHITVFLLNYIQHFFWDGSPLKEAWEIIDQRIMSLVNRCDNLIVLSDHGSNEINSVFYINNWLKTQGYLNTESDISDVFGYLGITEERLVELVNLLGVRDIAKQAPDILKSLFPQEEGAKREAKQRVIQWDNSSVVASGQGPVYISCSLEDQDETIEELITKIENLTTPRGNPVASQVYKSNDVYEGEYVSIGPDIVIEQAPGVHITDGIGNKGTFTEPTRWRAENDWDGIFLAHGKGINDSTLDTISILDIAPTILHLNGLAVPEDMEGNVLDIVKDKQKSGDVDLREPISVSEERYATNGAVEDRLEDLGYLEQ